MQSETRVPVHGNADHFGDHFFKQGYLPTSFQ